MANPLWVDQWSAADLEQLLHKRDVERKTFRVIAEEMGRVTASCWRRWNQLHACDDIEEVAAPPVAPSALHVQLGISTYVHRQAVVDYVGHSPHTFRALVTLPKVFA